MANIQLTVIPAVTGTQGPVTRYLTTTHQFLPTVVSGSCTLGMVVVRMVGGLVVLVRVRALLHRNETTGINQSLVALGLVVAFASGSTRIGLVIDPLKAMSETDLQLSSIHLLVPGGGGILLGVWVRGSRLVQAISNEYTPLGPRRSIAALISVFLIVQLAIVLGIPVSLNGVMIASIIEGRLAASSSGGNGTSLRKVGITIGSWVGSMPGMDVISYDLCLLLNAVPIVG